jgi:serine/threonine protein kinase
MDIQQMTRQEESPKSPQFHDISLEEHNQSHRRQERGLCLQDFKTIKFLGEGSFGRVLLAKKKTTCGHCSSEDVFAIKRVQNKFVSEVEKEVLLRAVGHPFLVQLISYFQEKDSFCYVMEYCEGGTLLSMILRLQRFHEDLVRFYAAEIILAVNFLHKCGIVHRDIKSDNILLDKDGHCRLADFGLAEIGMFKGMATQGVRGNARYRAPEMIRGRMYGPEVDWYSVGIVMADMIVGTFPAECHHHPEQPPLFLTKDAISIINMFQRKDPTVRLGAGGDTRRILMDPFFKSVDWEAVLQKRVKPPVKLVNSEFVIVDLQVHGDTDGSGSELSFKTASEGPVLEGPVLEGPVLEGQVLEGPVLEGPANKPQLVKCATVDL